MSIRVLMLSTGFDMGGAERQIADLSKALVERGYEVKIVSLTPLGHLAAQARSQGLDVQSVYAGRKANPAMLFQLYRVMRQWQPDIVHGHLIHANILSRIMCVLIPVPVVISTVHSYNEGKRWARTAYRLTERWVDKTVFVSGMSRKRYLKMGAVQASKTEVIPNGIDFSGFCPNHADRSRARAELGVGDRFVWLAAGRLEKAKDYPTMLKAFAEVLQVWPHADLLIAGEGTLKTELQLLADQLGIANHVKFLGLREDVSRLMAAADAFVLSSRYEGFGRVLVEAMACGLPVVSTACGGPEEILQQGRLGHLVSVGEASQLAGAMLQVMQSQSDSSRLEAASEYVRHSYEHDSVTREWMRLYDRLLAAKESGASIRECGEEN